MQTITSQMGRGILLAIGVVVPTVIFFAPLLGFHHIIACGILGPVVLNAETPPEPGDYVWREYAVRFFLGRFAVSVGLWFLTLWGVFRLFRTRPNAS
ncbi:MAG TPA: hypothetical protein VKY92_16660 [Verrucomicrobiae bacterium]|nr:hypothetical protein [Verrucomicrobiae bacterium]